LLPQINPFGMPPLMAADMLDADHIGGSRAHPGEIADRC
jgi:hypothetical protein